MRLKIKKTIDTPYVLLDNGYIKIEGKSMPENVSKFYAPVQKWLKEYSKNPARFTRIDLRLPYANNLSIKFINDILESLNDLFLKGNDMKVVWKYDADDDFVLEIGEDLALMVDIPFEYQEIKTISKQSIRMQVKNKITGKIGEVSKCYWESIRRNGHQKDFELLKQL